MLRHKSRSTTLGMASELCKWSTHSSVCWIFQYEITDDAHLGMRGWIFQSLLWHYDHTPQPFDLK